MLHVMNPETSVDMSGLSCILWSINAESDSVGFYWCIQVLHALLSLAVVWSLTSPDTDGQQDLCKCNITDSPLWCFSVHVQTCSSVSVYNIIIEVNSCNYDLALQTAHSFDFCRLVLPSVLNTCGCSHVRCSVHVAWGCYVVFCPRSCQGRQWRHCTVGDLLCASLQCNFYGLKTEPFWHAHSCKRLS